MRLHKNSWRFIDLIQNKRSPGIILIRSLLYLATKKYNPLQHTMHGSLVPRLSVTTRVNEGRSLIVFNMVMTTFYAYVIIIHTVTSHEHCVQDSVVVVVVFYL